MRSDISNLVNQPLIAIKGNSRYECFHAELFSMNIWFDCPGIAVETARAVNFLDNLCFELLIRSERTQKEFDISLDYPEKQIHMAFS